VRDLMIRRRQLPTGEELDTIAHNGCLGMSMTLLMAAARLRDIWRIRKAGEIAARVVEESRGDVGREQEYLERLEGEFAKLTRLDADNDSIRIMDSLKSAFGNIQERMDRPDHVPLPLAALTSQLVGLFKGELVIVAGRPGMGKSALMMQIAIEAARTSGPDGRPNGVAFFTLEMSNEALATRAACSYGRVDIQALRTNTMTNTMWASLSAASAAIAKASLILTEGSQLTPHQIRSKCRRLRRTFEQKGERLALVVVDYLQLMNGQSPTGRRSREEQVAACSGALKALAKELGVPVVAGAQLNRPDKKAKVARPQLTDLRESGAIEQDADVVVLIHRPEYYLKDATPEADRGIAELIVAKQRSGPTGIKRAQWFDRYTFFADLEEDRGYGYAS